ncbi:MAG: NUDIX domain-containing protein [Candidatus Helarchaeota archaeon]
MADEFTFIYKKEIWYISAFTNTEKLDVEKKAKEIEQILMKKVKSLTSADLANISWNQKLVEQVIECGKALTIQCKWITFINYFPFIHENLNLQFNVLGYLRFDVEYYKGNPKKKKEITPDLIQQVPTIALELLKQFCDQYVNRYLFIDRVSPIYVFVTFNKLNDPQGNLVKIKWSEENIVRYSQIIGKWTEIYSGQWADYSNTLYKRRIKNNFSNRLSELHYIKRNSGFIYMEEENYDLFFGGYMNDYVLEPTARVRTLQYALTCINESLDTIQSMLEYVTIDFIEKKIKSLRNLRGLVQTQLSIIYKDLDSNRRQHYTRVLTHLIDLFHITRMLNRVNEKFDVFHDSLEERYHEVDAVNQKRTERSMNFLNYLFGFAVVADVVDILIAALSGNWIVVGVAGTVIILVGIILILVTKNAVSLWWKTRNPAVKKTVDAVIIEDKAVALVQRKFPPFKGQFALPGGFIEKHESPKEAVHREVMEETGLSIEIIDRIGVYDDPNRDTRGLVATTAFLCKVKGSKDLHISEESTNVIWKPLEELKGIDLAFDHEIILKDAIKLCAKKGLEDQGFALDYENVLKDVA